MSKKRIDTSAGGALKGNPFAKLAGAFESLPENDAPEPAADAIPSVAESSAPRRAVVRYERKGRGGKEVTVVEGLGLEAAALAAWAKALKQTLGCGGHVEGECLVLAGDQRVRLPKLLESRGVARVIVS